MSRALSLEDDVAARQRAVDRLSMLRLPKLARIDRPVSVELPDLIDVDQDRSHRDVREWGRNGNKS